MDIIFRLSWVKNKGAPFVLLFPLFLMLFAIRSAHGDILHLELGAANYSMKYPNGQGRFSVLESKARELIATHGPNGIIYLNDYFPDGLNLAANHLRALFTSLGVNILVIELPGDYRNIVLPHVKTARLANPGAEQISSISTLENLAALSRTGLEILTTRRHSSS